jgi:hypothetical protein
LLLALAIGLLATVAGSAAGAVILGLIGALSEGVQMLRAIPALVLYGVILGPVLAWPVTLVVLPVGWLLFPPLRRRFALLVVGPLAGTVTFYLRLVNETELGGVAWAMIAAGTVGSLVAAAIFAAFVPRVAAAANEPRGSQQLRSGVREELVSYSCEGFAKFRDQAAAFNAFIRALHATLAVQGMSVRFERDEYPWVQRGRWAVAAGLIAMVAVLVVVMAQHGFPRWLTAVKLLLILALLPALLRWVRLSRGGHYDPHAIPVGGLPVERGAAAPGSVS